MTNGQLFIKENPNIKFKLNGSCVWIYFDGVNHYTMPTSWWEQEISLFNKIRAEIQENINYNKKMNYQGIVAGLLLTLTIIDKYKAEIEPQEISDCNLKMWHDIYEEEKKRERSDKE